MRTLQRVAGNDAVFRRLQRPLEQQGSADDPLRG
jgi:hypothetical protein